MMVRRSLRALVLSILTVSAIAVSAQTPTVRYVYDELGRLVAVIDQNGDAAVYNYDAVGNLLSITRKSSGSVAILEFTPNSGPVGTSVKLFGMGFSATPAPTISSISPTIGVGGTSVTIAGTNFQTDTMRNRVTFNVGHAQVASATSTVHRDHGIADVNVRPHHCRNAVWIGGQLRRLLRSAGKLHRLGRLGDGSNDRRHSQVSHGRYRQQDRTCVV